MGTKRTGRRSKKAVAELVAIVETVSNEVDAATEAPALEVTWPDPVDFDSAMFFNAGAEEQAAEGNDIVTDGGANPAGWDAIEGGAEETAVEPVAENTPAEEPIVEEAPVVKPAAKMRGPKPTLWMRETFEQLRAHLNRDLRKLTAGDPAIVAYYSTERGKEALEGMGRRLARLAMDRQDAADAIALAATTTTGDAAAAEDKEAAA